LKKLCLVTTDAKFLIDLLYGLSLREDCCYVKFATRAREGMYLGRCFMQSDRAAAELCAELKGHARVFMALEPVPGCTQGSPGVVRLLPAFRTGV
jgi:hypothetical protein